MILIYAFSNHWGTNVSHQTLIEFQNIVGASLADARFELIRGYPQEFFRKYIEYNNYSLIIGLGDGSKFSDKIKIETQAKNAYDDKEIYPFSPIFIDLNLPNVDIYDSHNFQISSNMGTYNCNWLTYKIQLYLNQHSPETLHLFLHLPQKSNANFLAKNIYKLILDNHICSNVGA